MNHQPMNGLRLEIFYVPNPPPHNLSYCFTLTHFTRRLTSTKRTSLMALRYFLDSRQKPKNTTVDVSSVRTRYRGATLVNMNFYTMFALLITIQLVVYCDCPIHLYVCANLHQPLAFCMLHS